MEYFGNIWIVISENEILINFWIMIRKNCKNFLWQTSGLAPLGGGSSFARPWNMNVVISKGVLHPRDLQNRIFLELVMIMTWYLGWGDFRAWKTFPEFLVNKCWLNFDIGCLICQNLPKNAKKGKCWLKMRGVL